MQQPPTPDWLERANRLALIAGLLSSTVHDVNNALQVIAGSVELLQMAPSANDVVQRRVTAIDTQTKRASRLLQELTGFVRDARTQAEPVELKAAAHQVLTARHYSITKLRITGSVEGDEVTVRVSPKHLQQILLNLVINAEDAKCSALAIRVGRDGDHATVSVEDDAPQHETVGGTREAASSNLGIGLEVSTWLAGHNGGTLTREPLPGGGSRAVLRLPV